MTTELLFERAQALADELAARGYPATFLVTANDGALIRMTGRAAALQLLEESAESSSARQAVAAR